MSAHLGRRGLDLLRDQLSERELGVLRSVHEHRFLTARQIEALHFHGHGSPLGAARVCRRVLARLTEERVFNRLHRRVGGIRAGSASFIYKVGPIGARLLNQPARSAEPSSMFLDHTLAVADTHIALLQAARYGRFELVCVEVEPDCWRRYVGPGGSPEVLKPDLRVMTATGAYEDSWFLEVDRGTESPAALRRKCHAYDTYWRTGTEQDTFGAFPLVLWIAPSATRAGQIKGVIDRAGRLHRNLFRVTTANDLVTLISGGAG